MNRRDFIQSTSKGLLASAGLVFGHTAAGMKSVAVTPPGTDHSVTLFLCGELTRLKMTPMRIRRFQLTRASGEEASWLAATMDRESRRFESRVELQEDQSLILYWGSAVLQESVNSS